MEKKEAADNAERVEWACERVGRFYNWAMLKSTINKIIKTLFDLKDLEGEIIVANINFRDRVYILHNILLWQGTIHSDEWRRDAKKAIRRLVRLNQHRNTLAHNLFWPLDDGGTVLFSKAVAKGEFRLSDIRWEPYSF